jgi:hypothetical protein
LQRQSGINCLSMAHPELSDEILSRRCVKKTGGGRALRMKFNYWQKIRRLLSRAALVVVCRAAPRKITRAAWIWSKLDDEWRACCFQLRDSIRAPSKSAARCLLKFKLFHLSLSLSMLQFRRGFVFVRCIIIIIIYWFGCDPAAAGASPFLISCGFSSKYQSRRALCFVRAALFLCINTQARKECWAGAWEFIIIMVVCPAAWEMYIWAWCTAKYRSPYVFINQPDEIPMHRWEKVFGPKYNITFRAKNLLFPTADFLTPSGWSAMSYSIISYCFL